jgi:hypothetical protein
MLQVDEQTAIAMPIKPKSTPLFEGCAIHYLGAKNYTQTKA